MDTLDPSRRDVLRLLSSAALGAPIASSVAGARQREQRLPQEGVFELGDLRLESGATLPNATRPVPSFCRTAATETIANAYEARSRTL